MFPVKQRSYVTTIGTMAVIENRENDDFRIHRETGHVVFIVLFLLGIKGLSCSQLISRLTVHARLFPLLMLTVCIKLNLVVNR